MEWQGEFQAVLVFGRRPNHLLHWILTLVTFGFWGLIWIAIALGGGEKKEIIKVDEWGHVSVTRF